MFLAEKQQNNAIVMIGRMNPPTAGHYRVINQMKKYARETGGTFEHVVVVIAGKETSKDKSKNPLSPEDRIRFMKASGRANGVKFLVATDAMDAFEKVRAEGLEPLVIAAGSDRADSYVKMLDEYFPIEQNGKTIKHRKVLGLERTPSDKPVFGMDVQTISASAARHAAEGNFFDEFVEIVGLEKNKKLAKMLFDKVKSSMASSKEST